VDSAPAAEEIQDATSPPISGREEPLMGERAEEGRRHLWDDPKNVQILIWVFWGCCAVIFALDLFVHRHRVFSPAAGSIEGIEGMVGFYSFYGFVACVLLVLAAKQMRRVLMLSEDYYGDRPSVAGGASHGKHPASQPSASSDPKEPH
jgi:hypothetical protein